ncbi:MAG: GerMN domain-containing protein [Actinobacteria bacterium]|nr:GerMN domain-containing protein [Actinomycetota bacterium]
MRKVVLIGAALLALIIIMIGCTGSDVPPPTVSMPEKPREISVFYATGRTIVEERHIVEDDKDIIKTALNEVLTAQPQINADIAIVQPECKVIDVKLDKKGLATINFSKEVLDFTADRKEKLLAYGAILETLKQFDGVKSFRFLVEGKEKGKINGKDIQKFWGVISLFNQPQPIDRPSKK